MRGFGELFKWGFSNYGGQLHYGDLVVGYINDYWKVQNYWGLHGQKIVFSTSSWDNF